MSLHELRPHQVRRRNANASDRESEAAQAKPLAREPRDNNQEAAAGRVPVSRAVRCP